MSDEQRGLRDCYTNTTLFNQLEFIIERKIKEMVNTSAVVRIDGCTSSGADAAAGTVSATPLVSQTDPDGHALPMTSIPRMPHGRVQGGIAALIIDPVPGDIGVASFCKTDSSTVQPGTTEPQRPGSHRSFDQADGMLVATVSNKAPEVWIELKQDKTIVIHAPEGCTIETDKDTEINCGQNCKINAPAGVEIHTDGEMLIDAPLTRITGALIATGERGSGLEMTGDLKMRGDIDQTGQHTSTGDQVAGAISQINHTHTGVEPGGGSTGKPQ